MSAFELFFERPSGNNERALWRSDGEDAHQDVSVLALTVARPPDRRLHAALFHAI